LSRHSLFNRIQCPWHEWKKIFELVTPRHQHDYADIRPPQVLLKLKVLVPRQEYVKSRVSGPPQKLSIFETCPADLLDRKGIMPD